MVNESSTLKGWGAWVWSSVKDIALALVLYVVIWVVIVHGVFVWILSAGVGYFIFAESTTATKTFANELVSFSLIASTITLLWGFARSTGDDRGLVALFYGWFGGAFFTLFFLVLSWIAPNQIPSPPELALTVGICASVVAFLAAIDPRQ